MRTRRSLRAVLLLLLGVACVKVSAPSGQGSAGSGSAGAVGKVLTVNGPIDPGTLGKTLTCEHIFANFDNAHRPPPTESTKLEIYRQPLTIGILGAVLMGNPNKDNFYLTDEQTAVSELMHYKMAGGRTIVDVTSIGLGRDPEALRRVANATGLHIVMGSSWYRKDWHPETLSHRSVADLTGEIVRDLTVGVADTGVRAGIVGAVGTDGNPLTANEVKVIRASAQASRLTGAALSVHTGAARGINEQSGILDLLQAEGADLNRVIIGQCDYLANDLPILERLLDRGAYVQFDGLSEFSPMLRRPVTDAHVARGIVQLIKKGYLKRILLSQGVDGKIALKAYGGRGYSSVLELFVPHLKRLGVTADQIETILIGNPKTVLTFVSARPQR